MAAVGLVIFLISRLSERGARLPSISEPTVGDLVQHFEGKGVVGTYTPGAAALFGAKEVGAFESPAIDATILRFEDRSQAESLEKSGFQGRTCHRNGRFILIVRQGEDQILPAFKSF